MKAPPSTNDVFSPTFESHMDPFFSRYYTSPRYTKALTPDLEATAENIEFWSVPQGPDLFKVRLGAGPASGVKINQEKD